MIFFTCVICQFEFSFGEWYRKSQCLVELDEMMLSLNEKLQLPFRLFE